MTKEAKASIDIILEPLNERLKAPFTGAFFLSFLLLNWKVFIIILSFEYNKGIDNLFCILEDQYLNIHNVLWYPLLSAFAYIIIAPLTASLAAISKEFFVKKLKNRLVLLIRNSKPISYEEYKNVIDQNLLLRNEVVDFDIKVTSLSEKGSKLDTDNKKLQKETQELKETIPTAMINNFYKFMEGTWKLEWNSQGKEGSEFAKFNKFDSSYLYSHQSSDNYEPVFEIKGIFIDESKSVVQFTKYELSNRVTNNKRRRVLFNDLKISTENNQIILSGTENGDSGTVKYIKKHYLITAPYTSTALVFMFDVKLTDILICRFLN